jgi:hypothetical protein
LNEIPEPMVIALLPAGRGRHADDHRPFVTPLNFSTTMAGVGRSDDNSRKKVQNVHGDSSEVRSKAYALKHVEPAETNGRFEVVGQ